MKNNTKYNLKELKKYSAKARQSLEYWKHRVEILEGELKILEEELSVSNGERDDFRRKLIEVAKVVKEFQ